MVHEQLMTQKITPKNSPEQGVDLSGKDGTEKALLPLPISLAQLQELSTPRAVQHRGLHPHAHIQAPLPVTSHRVEMRWWRGKGLGTPHFPHTKPVSNPKKNTLGNDVSINSIKNCSAEPCGTIETCSLPVRWVAFHKNWLFQGNSINTCYCFLVKQYTAIYCTSSRKPNLLSFPCL